MTTDPPPSEFEDVQIDSWQTRLPSAICTNKEIFDEIFSLETWKTVLQPDQRDRILKMLPAELLKIPGAAEKTIEDFLSKHLVNFGTNPLDSVFDKLINGHYDPIVVETKNNIVREWRRESLRLKKHYHTKLLQDIVISREKHLRKLAPISPVQKRNGRRTANVETISKNSTTKKNGKPSTIVSFTSASNGTSSSNGVSAASGGKTNKNNQQILMIENSGVPSVNATGNRITKPADAVVRNKRGRLEAASLSPPTPIVDEALAAEGPANKRAKQTTPKTKSTTNKKAKEQQIIVVTTSQPSPSSSHSTQVINSPSLLENGNESGETNQKTSLLLGTLTAGSTPIESPTISLRSTVVAPPPTSLLESLTSPINPPAHTLSFSGSDATATGVLTKSYSKIFPTPVIPASPASSSQSPSYLPSPVQSSPILASQLQAPSPISVNLSSITGIGSITSRNGSGTASPSHSSITLNYTQAPLAPPPAATIASLQHHNQKGLLEDESSSDEFEFETIEPTIGFGGPSALVTTTTTSTTASKSMVSTSVPSQTMEFSKKGVVGTITTQELANIQKCSLLTNCLTQPLPPSSSSTAAVSAALANNILTSTPVAVTPSGGVHQILLQQQQPQKIIVTSGGIVSTSSGISSQQHQQLQKFLSAPLQTHNVSTAQKRLTQQQIGMFQPQQLLQRIATTGHNSAVDAQTLVGSIMASSKDLLATFGASVTSGTGSSSSLVHQSQQPPTQQQSSQNVLLSLQSGAVQQTQLKQTTFVRTSPSVGHGHTGLLQAPVQTLGGLSHQIVSLAQQTQSSQSVVIGQSSNLNTQSLQLPSSILSSGNITSTAKFNSTSASSSSISTLLDSDDLNLNLGSFTLGGLAGMNLDMGSVALSDIDTSGIGAVVGGAMGVDSIKLEMDCAIDKMDDLSGVLDGNPFDSIPNLSDELDGLDLDMVDGLCDFEVLLSEEKQYASFFSLIREVLCSTRDHRMTLICLEKTIRKWQISPGAALNPWYMRVQDWNSALIVALNFLAGNYQDVHPEDFVPYIEYKYKTKYYQWIGAGRDGDNNLTPLCVLWLDNLDRLPPLKKSEGDGDEPEEEEDENDDSDTAGGGDSSDAKKKNKRPQTPPPPRCTTDWTVRPSTSDEKEEFRQQEKSRFDNPHKAFTYRMHGYESVVGPVKGVYSSQTGVTNKARGHSLLVDDRPPYVTILALVRDAVARLPNGEGTRSEICEMLRDSAFLAPEASNVTLNSVVSGALDRLHYERDPCVRYDSHKKSWIYLHRDRTQEQFERLHHNRSYTKSTKSRNISSRKSRKGSSKSSTSSVSSITGVSTTHPPQSSSSSSSQSSTAETAQSGLGGSNASTTVATILGVGSGAGGIVSTTTGGSTVTLPPLSKSNPKVSSIAASTSPLSGALAMHQSQAVKQALGVANVTSGGGTTTPHQQLSQTISGIIQQQAAPPTGNTRGMITLSSGGTELLHQGQSSTTASGLHEVLAAAAGLKFQTASGGGAPMVLNQTMLGQHQQQGEHQQTTFIQDSSGQSATARLVLQQQTTSALVQQQGHSVPTQATGLQIQQQQQGQHITSAGSQAAASIGPGQILLGPSAAVLKLAGNIRLGEGLRLAQLRLPNGGTTVGTGSSLTTSSSALRLPQHRILLARGALPGQPQAQGVLLGQTSTGQTVILSAGPAGAGSLAGLQALGAAGTTSGQIAVHTSAQSSQIHLDTSQTTMQQQHTTFGHQQSLQAFTTNQGTTKFGIITSTSTNPNSIMVSSGPPTSLQQGTGVTYSTPPRIQQQLVPSGQNSTLPPTSIAMPASIFAPAQTSSLNSTVTAQTPPSSSLAISTSRPQQSHQQQLILSGAGRSTARRQSQSSAHNPIISGVAASGQLQASLTQAVQNAQQQSNQHQNLMLTPTLQHSTGNSQNQGQTQSGQAHHQLSTPIIIRSAQGDFVSFGIPSHLSLGRGVQGIKVIPFQTGKQTVLARIVPPPSHASGTPGGANGGNVGMALSGGANSGTALAAVCSSANVIVTTSASSATFANAISNATALVSGMQLPVQQQPSPLPTTNNSGTGGTGIATMVSGSIVNTQSSTAVTVNSSTSSATLNHCIITNKTLVRSISVPLP